MLARLVGLVLGTVLATSGYVIAGLGVLGDWAQHLDLGPFEPHRPFAGWAAAITGARAPRRRPDPAPQAQGAAQARAGRLGAGLRTSPGGPEPALVVAPPLAHTPPHPHPSHHDRPDPTDPHDRAPARRDLRGSARSPGGPEPRRGLARGWPRAGPTAAHGQPTIARSPSPTATWVTSRALRVGWTTPPRLMTKPSATPATCAPTGPTIRPPPTCWPAPCRGWATWPSWRDA
jgi:hypothetical protein